MAHFAGTRKLAFAIRSSKIQGKGAFATRRIQKGARIIEYLGECIDEDEADIRYPDDEMGRHHTFLFSIGDGSRVLDAGPIDWPAKYINHSCDPNCEAIEEEDGRVFISALKNIPAGAELHYDYAYERTAEHTEADEQMYVCRCGSPKCRGTIMAPPKPKKGKKKDKNKDKNKDKKKRKAEREARERKARTTEVQRGSTSNDPDPATDAARGASARKHAAGHVEQHALKKAAKKAGKKSAKKSSHKAAKRGVHAPGRKAAKHGAGKKST